MLMSVVRPGAAVTMGMRGTVGRRGGGVAKVMLFEEITSGRVGLHGVYLWVASPVIHIGTMFL